MKRGGPGSEYQRAFSIYVFIGVFSVNFFMYGTYYSLGADLPASEIMLLTGAAFRESLSLWGFVLSIPTATVASLLCYGSQWIQGIYERILGNILGIFIAGVISSLFLPVSIPSAGCYIVFVIVVGVSTTVNHPLIIEVPNLERQGNARLLTEAVHFAHNRLSILMRDTIWIAITLFVGPATVMIVYLSNIAGPIMSEAATTRIFYQSQTIFFGAFLFYAGAGYLATTSVMVCRRMIELEKSYRGFVDRLPEPTQHQGS
jgi:hypothetical protein